MDSGAFGALALWGAVAAAAMAIGLGGWMWAAHGGRAARPIVSASRGAGLFAVALASAALAALVWSLLTGNYALAYVADTTTRQGSWYYRLAGLWGGNGGSLLLWGWILLVAGVWATRHSPPARLIATAAGGSVLLVAAVAANPFQHLLIPAIDGGGLNPILQYPAMLYHPLVLYAGHAGLVAPFALAVAGLAAGATRRSPAADAAWWAAIRRTTLVAWLLLGVGLVAGARWSYVELGWGGFWGWDPVENSGLLPWLAATAFLHAARRARLDGERRPSVGLVALAGVPFCLSLLGAALSRSGAAQSVHAFADARAVGRGLSLLLAAAVAALAGAAIRAAQRQAGAPSPASPPTWAAGVVGDLRVMMARPASAAEPVGDHEVTGIPDTPAQSAAPDTPAQSAAPDTPAQSAAPGTPAQSASPTAGAQVQPAALAAGVARPQSAALTAGVVVLLSVAAVVAFGTVFPVLSHLAGAGTVDVTVEYYAKVVTPLAVIAALLMGVAPSLPRRVVGSPRAALPRGWRWWSALGAAGVAAAAMARPGAVASMALGAATAAAAVLTTAELLSTHSLRRAGALIAHLGIALLLLGVAGSLLGRETTAVLPVGGSINTGGYTLRYRDVALDQGPGWQRARVILDVSRGGHHLATLEPGLKVFSNQAAALSQVAIRATNYQDLIVAVRSVDPATSAADLDVTARPLVTLVWWGGVATALGGILVLAASRRRRAEVTAAAGGRPASFATAGPRS